MSDEQQTNEAIAKRIDELQAQVDQINSRIQIVRKNTKNIAFLRNVGVGIIAALALASAWDWSLSETGILPSFHGERLHTLLTAFISAGGLVFLGFKKIEQKEEEDD